MIKHALMSAAVLLLLSSAARADTQLMSGHTYDQAKAADLWVINGLVEARPGETSRWVSCVDISEAQGEGVSGIDHRGQRVVVVNVGQPRWVWAAVNSPNPCSSLPRTVARSPLGSVAGQLTLPTNSTTATSTTTQGTTPISNTTGTNTSTHTPDNDREGFGDINRR